MKMIEKLKQHVSSVGFEQVKKDWMEIKEPNFIGVSVSQYLETVRCYRQSRGIPQPMNLVGNENLIALVYQGLFFCIYNVCLS